MAIDPAGDSSKPLMAMLTSGPLIRLMASVTKIPEPTVAEFVRELRKGGLFSTSGRGLSAAKVTAIDVAHLLLALIVTERPTRAVQAVEDFGVNLLFEAPPNEDESAAPALPEGTALEFALARIFEHYVNAQAIRDPETNELIYQTAGFSLEFKLDELAVLLHAPDRKYSFVHITQIKGWEAQVRGDREARDAAYANYHELTARYAKPIKTTRVVLPDFMEQLAAPFRTPEGQ